MTDPNDRFDALLEAMLTKPEPSAEPAPDGEGEEGDGQNNPDHD
jgi:hypothetical protein